MILAINTQAFWSIHPIFIIEFYQFTANFPRQSHFEGMCERTTEELVDPPHILTISYAEYLSNDVLWLVSLVCHKQIFCVRKDRVLYTVWQVVWRRISVTQMAVTNGLGLTKCGLDPWHHKIDSPRAWYLLCFRALRCVVCKGRVGHCTHNGFFMVPIALFWRTSLDLDSFCLESNALLTELSLPAFC